MNGLLQELLAPAKKIAVLGHIRPDGDCVGSCLALYLYVKRNYPDKEIHVWLQESQDRFAYLEGFRNICHHPDGNFRPDLAVALDVSDYQRLGEFSILFDRAQVTLNIDHHVTNPGFAQHTVCPPHASSACEVLSGLLDRSLIDRDMAACLYTGIVTDTGVFKYEATSADTMECAGFLMSKGIPFGEIIDGAFYRKTWPQNQVMGLALTKASRRLDGKLICSVITGEDKKAFKAHAKDLDGIAEQMRLTEGCECAVLCYETDLKEWKLSLRSVNTVDVSAIAAEYGGGGHMRASGCTFEGGRDPWDILEEITGKVRAQLEAGQGAC